MKHVSSGTIWKMTGSLFTDPPGGGSGGAGHRGAKHNVFFKVTNTFYESNIELHMFISGL